MPGYTELGGFSEVKVPSIALDGGSAWAHVAVCGPVTVGNQAEGNEVRGCPFGAAACLVKNG